MKFSSCCGHGRALRGLLILGFAGLILGHAEAGEARTETIRWTHPAPSGVAGFRLTWVYETSTNATTVEVGVPSPAAGVYAVEIEVPDDHDVFFTMTAYDAQGRESQQSNVLLRAAPQNLLLGQPGRPEVVSSD